METAPTKYESPACLVIALESEGFLCTSIKGMRLQIDVDEYANIDSEDVDFDSDWY